MGKNILCDKLVDENSNGNFTRESVNHSLGVLLYCANLIRCLPPVLFNDKMYTTKRSLSRLR